PPDAKTAVRPAQHPAPQPEHPAALKTAPTKVLGGRCDPQQPGRQKRIATTQYQTNKIKLSVMNIHLVDGTYELFRNHFGAPPKKAPDGREVGATLGLLRSLLMLLTSPGVTHVGVAFDHVIESFRNDLYTGYKTGEGVDPNLIAQFPLAEEAVAALGVVVWPMVEFEADDALATAANRFRKTKSVEQIVVCSPDKDLAQLVSGDKIVCWDRRREII